MCTDVWEKENERKISWQKWTELQNTQDPNFVGLEDREEEEKMQTV